MTYNGLYDWQKDAVDRLHNGAILYGPVGSGKSLTSLTYYMKVALQKHLYIITTAKKRDTKDWERDTEFLRIKNVTVDSWNNISKYTDVRDGFFIFDEQRAVGYGKWSKSLIHLATWNKWIMLSGTPGDTWSDYIPVFVANGFYKNKTEFINEHVEFDRFAKYPKIKAYHNQTKLIELRKAVLVPMEMPKRTVRHKIEKVTKYDKELYDHVKKERYNPYTDAPIKNPSEYTQVCRRIVAESAERVKEVEELIRAIPRAIIFYNYNYERQILLNICERQKKPYAEWTGHKHQQIPEAKKWIYVVQYTAGAEGWNCTDTDTIIFYSPNYSYKMMEQAEGRVDRLNTPYTDLYYYMMKSDSPIDKAVYSSITRKKRFNALSWGKKANHAREQIPSRIEKRYSQDVS